MSVLSRPHFHDEAAAFEYVEAALWPKGPICPHCGCVGRISALAPVHGSKSKKNPEGSEEHLMKSPNCPKESRHESTLPSGATGSLSGAKAVTGRPPVKTTKR